jgi:hypothetical protein
MAMFAWTRSREGVVLRPLLVRRSTAPLLARGEGMVDVAAELLTAAA